MKPFRTTLAILLFPAFALAAPTAPRMDIKKALTPDDVAQLKSAITAARASHPAWFQRFAGVRGFTPEGYGMNRNPIPAVHPELRALGKDAFLPIVEALVFDAPRKIADASGRDGAALDEALVDTLGELRNPRALPILNAVWTANGNALVTAAAARGLGRQCDDAIAQRLASALNTDRDLAATSGLGQCRTVAGARLLAAALASSSGDLLVARARAAGQAGSSWAWSARSAKDKEQFANGELVRGILSEALVLAWARADGERGAIEKALMMNAHPSGAAALRTVANERAELRDRALSLAQRLERRK